MRKIAFLYIHFAKTAIRAATAHRSAFWAGVAGQWLGYGATFATLYIMVTAFDALAGWSADEMIFMYAVNLLSYAIAATFFYNPSTTLATKIRTGEFDGALTKPTSPFLHEFYTGFNFGYVSHVSLSFVVMIMASVNAKLSFSPLAALTFLAMLLGAILVQAAFMIAISSASFFLIQENPLFELSYAIQKFTQYPIAIYPLFLQIVLTFVLPVAFMNFYPASAILGKDGGASAPGAFSPALGYCTPLVGIILFALSVLLWNWALSKYQSVGS
ncbi:MAG: ABC-2 family transporter protein [Treponema sp.]|nr:ABC-2 family transporter protein [Treponema sp.]